MFPTVLENDCNLKKKRKLKNVCSMSVSMITITILTTVMATIVVNTGFFNPPTQQISRWLLSGVSGEINTVTGMSDYCTDF